MHFLPKRAYLHWLRWSLGKVFFFNRLQNLDTVSGGSPSPVVLTTITNTSSFSRWNCSMVYSQMEGGVQLNKQMELGQVENAETETEVRKWKYRNGNTEVRRKAAYRFTNVPCRQRVTVSK